MTLAQLIQKVLFSWCPPCFLAFTLFCLLFFWGGSLSTEKRGLMDTSHFEVCVPRNLSLSFYIISDGRSLDLFSSAPGESFSDDGQPASYLISPSTVNAYMCAPHTSGHTYIHTQMLLDTLSCPVLCCSREILRNIMCPTIHMLELSLQCKNVMAGDLISYWLIGGTSVLVKEVKGILLLLISCEKLLHTLLLQSTSRSQ